MTTSCACAEDRPEDPLTRLNTLLDTIQQPLETLAVRDLYAIRDTEIEALYLMGYQYYQSGKLEAALTLFKGLVTLDHLEQRFWLGLGGVQQRLHDFQAAVRSYAMASLLDIHDPRPQLSAAECYLKLNQLHEAESALLALERFCPYSAEGELYRAKGRILKQSLAQRRKLEGGES